jgi:hypothetical protein
MAHSNRQELVSREGRLELTPSKFCKNPSQASLLRSAFCNLQCKRSPKNPRTTLSRRTERSSPFRVLNSYFDTNLIAITILLMRTAYLLALVALLADSSAFAKVAARSLEELVASSDAIVLARVERVSKPIIRKKWAVASVTSVWKGTNESKVTFLASPTWTCDISEAKQGETVVLFLVKYKKAGRYVLALSGRGRMPIRDVGGKAYATF